MAEYLSRVLGVTAGANKRVIRAGQSKAMWRFAQSGDSLESVRKMLTEKKADRSQTDLCRLIPQALPGPCVRRNGPARLRHECLVVPLFGNDVSRPFSR